MNTNLQKQLLNMTEQEYRELIHCMRLSQRIRNIQAQGVQDDVIASKLNVTPANVKAMWQCAFESWSIRQIARLEVFEDEMFGKQDEEVIQDPTDKKEE